MMSPLHARGQRYAQWIGGGLCWAVMTLLMGGVPAAAQSLEPLSSDPVVGSAPLAAATPEGPQLPPIDTSSIEAAQGYKEAMHQLAGGDRARAEDLLRRALLVDPHYVKARYALGTLLDGDANPTAALSQFQLGLADEPSHPKLLTNMGIVELKLGHLSEAEQSLQQAHTLEPDSPYPLNALGLLREKQQRDEDARQYFEQALAAASSFSDAHVNLGLLALSRHQSAEAARQFVLAGDRNASALNGLGVLRWYEGKLDAAEGFFNQAVVVDRSNGAACYNLGLYLSTAGRYQEARYYLDTLQDTPGMAAAALTLEGAIERQEGHREQALQKLNKALALDPGLASANTMVGLLALEGNDLDEAELHLVNAVDTNANDSTAHNDLGLVYERRGKLEKAIEEVGKAALLAPDVADIRYNLGHLYDLEGQHALAVAQLQRYLALLPQAPDGADVKRRIAELRKLESK